MDPAEQGERWVQMMLGIARPAFARRDAALAFSSLAEYEASLRSQVEAFLAPVDEYIGKTVAEAGELAEARSEKLCVHPTGHRGYLSPRRVHAEVQDGTVVAARRDRPGWLDEAGPTPHR